MPTKKKTVKTEEQTTEQIVQYDTANMSIQEAENLVLSALLPKLMDAIDHTTTKKIPIDRLLRAVTEFLRFYKESHPQEAQKLTIEYVNKIDADEMLRTYKEENAISREKPAEEYEREKSEKSSKDTSEA